MTYLVTFGALYVYNSSRRARSDAKWKTGNGLIVEQAEQATVGGANLNLINAKSHDDCVHKGLR